MLTLNRLLQFQVYLTQISTFIQKIDELCYKKKGKKQFHIYICIYIFNIQCVCVRVCMCRCACAFNNFMVLENQIRENG